MHVISHAFCASKAPAPGPVDYQTQSLPLLILAVKPEETAEQECI